MIPQRPGFNGGGGGGGGFPGLLQGIIKKEGGGELHPNKRLIGGCSNFNALEIGGGGGRGGRCRVLLNPQA